MDLILWRHADAEDGFPDTTRKLTEKGEKHAQLVAQWLKPRLPNNLSVLVSPAKRALQTADALTSKYEIRKELAPGADVATVLAAAGWPSAKGAVIIVGHQPTLARAAAFLLSGEEADWSMKKGSIWWLSNRIRQGEKQTILRAVISPEFL
ncbi:phosphohistidine phosphatase SixA [Sulfurirhabdus autotrophica]|uniref:Phosphohistidine phosphatase SixA n=1 Tax=Sulfurirhabdus autotrophica TaxID=1706046 RepID=A0A4R3YJA7_9PROT|nr:phosphohistidine phosphatase SixA [Sulfurirhabdus autotrophica]TCV90793.1 phosphohistidine phosphatase SixA [Sulfurirhabdus autotrophica]